MVQPLASASASDLQGNTSLSTMISLSVLSSNGTEIPILTDDEHPIEIIIPRDPNFAMPSMFLCRVTSIRGHKEQFYFHLINITQTNNLTVSLHVEMQPIKKGFNYLLIMKFDAEPQLNSALKDIDDWFLWCISSKYSYNYSYFKFIIQHVNFRHNY